MIVEFYHSMMDFSACGRINKKEYQNFFLNWAIITAFLTIICTICFIFTFNIKIDFATIDITRGNSLSLFPFFFLVLFSSISIFFEIWAAIIGGILTVKRLHDLNLSGLYYWLITLSLIMFSLSDGVILSGFLMYIILGCVLFLSLADSYPYSNKYDIKDKKVNIAENSINGKVSI